MQDLWSTVQMLSENATNRSFVNF